MATFAELQTRVEHIVIDLPTSVTAQVQTLIKEAIRSLQRDHNFKVMEAETSLLSTATATRVLSAVPSDFKELRGLPYEIMADGTVRELLNPANRVAIIREWGTTAGGEAETDLHNGNPQAILIGEPTSEAGAMNFEVYPLPDGQSLYANGQYRIVVPYWKYLTALSASSDTNWFTANAEQWIVWKAASEGLTKAGEECTCSRSHSDTRSSRLLMFVNLYFARISSSVHGGGCPAAFPMRTASRSATKSTKRSSFERRRATI